VADRQVAEDRMISVVDPEARHTRESPEAHRDGLGAHVAADPQTRVITDEKLTEAVGQDRSDPATTVELLATEVASAEHSGAGGAAVSSQDTGDDRDGDQPLAWSGDGAYGARVGPVPAYHGGQPCSAGTDRRRALPGILQR